MHDKNMIPAFPRIQAKVGIYFLSSLLSLVFGVCCAFIFLAIAPQQETFFLGKPLIDGLNHHVLWMHPTLAPHQLVTQIGSHTFFAPFNTLSPFCFLLLNNLILAIVLFLCNRFTLSGVGAFTPLFWNGFYALGGPLNVCFHHHMGWALLAFMLPHALLEILGLLLFCTAGRLEKPFGLMGGGVFLLILGAWIESQALIH